MTLMQVQLDPGAFLPERAHPTDAGLDLRSPQAVWIHPGEHAVIDTGVHVAIPDGCVGLLTSRSGMMKQDITNRGTIDAGYTGSIKAVLFNHGSEGYAVKAGDKITQLVILPITNVALEVVEQLGETERGDAGFGSSGR